LLSVAAQEQAIPMQKVLSIGIVVISFLVFIPVSWRLADPLFSHPFPKQPVELPVLLVWPDHVEIRMLRNLSEVSPIPKDAGYTLSIEPQRQAWVEAAVRATPTPRPDKSSWVIRITQIGAGRQRVDLELLGDGIYGMIYEARSNEIIPLRWRLTGPLGAVFVCMIDALLCVIVWFGYQFIRRRMRGHGSLDLAL
jgi:hypothetical protein